MRGKLKKEQDPEILKRICGMYDDLRYECMGFDRNKITPEMEDIFQDTIMQVASDNIPDMSCAGLTAHFIRRFNMVRYQTIMDRKQRKEDHANNL